MGRIEAVNAESILSSPYKGEAGRGMGCEARRDAYPIPTPALPLKGREGTFMRLLRG